MNTFKKLSKWFSSYKDKALTSSVESSEYIQEEFAETVSNLLNGILSKKKYSLKTDYKEANYVDYFTINLSKAGIYDCLNISAFVGEDIYFINIFNTEGNTRGLCSLNTDKTVVLPKDFSKELISYVMKYKPSEFGGTYIKDKNSSYGTNVMHYLYTI